MKNIYKYDAIVIGAGNGGLIAATELAKKNIKTLLLEKHNLPGGFATSFVRGRFEFEASLHELGAVGNYNNPGYVYKIFEDLGIQIDWIEIPEAFCVYVKNDKTNSDNIYTLPFGKENFAKKLNEYEPGSYDETIRFLNICKELLDCSNALTENRGELSSKILKKHFPDFLTTGSYSLWEVLEKFKLSKVAKNILCFYWPYLGAEPKKLDFVLYANMFAEYIYYGAYIPKNRSNEISTKIISKYIEYGGEVWFNTEANKINVKNNQIISVETDDSIINTKHVIANISPNVVYSKLINFNEVNDYERKLINYRKLNKQGFCIFLGLNISAQELNLDKYSYFMYSNIDQNICASNLDSLDKNNEYIVVVLNNAYNNCSPKNTCIISITTLYNDAWSDIKQEEYFKLKEKIAYKFISDFEKRLNIKIFNHIEEIEIATPVTFARYTSSLNGNIYGYLPDKQDGVIVRSANREKEIKINGLIFSGAYSFRCHGYSTTYMSGKIAGLITYERLAKEKKSEK